MSRITDPDYLRDDQYRTDVNLGSRMALHDRFGTGGNSWFARVFDLIPQRSDLEILEVGAGTGRLWRDNHDRIPAGWRLTLTDISDGMLVKARASVEREGTHFLRADVGQLPFEDDAFDVAIANHMLYHLRDPEDGIRELRRVLRMGGKALAATNGHGHMRELWDLVARCFPLGRSTQIREDRLPFHLENGAEYLGRHFGSVERVDLHSELWVTEAKPLVAYVLSTPIVRSAGLSPAEFESSTDKLWAEAEARVAADGGLRITRQTGIFLAT